MPSLRAVTDWRKLMAGDDLSHLVTIYDGAVVYDFSAASSVSCAMTDGYQRQYIGPTAQSSGASGAAWSTGALIVEFPSLYSYNLTRGDVWLEIQIIKGGKRYSPPLLRLEVETGVIP